ncbi:MFS transporter [Rhodanobacter denitrificans]|uniref:Arabinose efflux permease family protein n=1 Tax=Rhodanobacter denitrificans TaxID=666685 RepID=I4WS10_9GAMM|nr:MFS transporter [Rhodanobacter denitrificans]AGG89451.1 arabinose efflux permease family protein [Rhodanobacter denitrificans]EIM02252.1 major facilitator family transporter [Rhodanobacter denitrificans]UJM88331.1 MFS transporter [Rhodanobacter denitrificans]UJM88652.1 MFS transporter [Rhodanobacter denitrificans]
MTDSADGLVHHGTPAFRRTNLALFAAGFATFGLLYCVQPLMPEFSRHYAVSEAAAALSLSLTTGVLAFAMLFAGGVSDAWGRKPVMVASLLASALLVLVTAAMPDWTALLVVRTLLGLTLSGLPAVAMTYLGEEMDADSIGLGMGLYISGSAVGGMGGRLISGVLADFFGWRIGVAVVGVIGVLAGLVFWRALPPSRHFMAQPLRWRTLAGRFAGMFRDRGLPWLFVEGFLLLGAFVTVYNYLGYRLMAPPYKLSQAVVGSIFAIYLIGTFSSAWMGHLAGKRGRRKVLWTAFALMLVGVALSMARPLPLVMLGIVAITFGFFGGHSIVSSWVGRRAGAAKAQAASVYLFCYYMGSSIAGASGGLFYASFGWSGVALFVGLLVLAGLAIALALFRLPPLADVATPPTPMSKGAMG